MRSLITRSLRYYWRTHLAILAGVLVASTVLTGALFVGDSVKASLRRLVEERSGGIDSVLLGNDRFFTRDLADRAAALMEGSGATVLPIIQVQGTVANADGTARVSAIQVMGVPPSFWGLRGEEATIGEDEAWINGALGERLGVKEGDTVLARVEQPGALSRDAPLSGETDAVVTMRLRVGRVVAGEAFGNYSLKAEQAIPSNLFVSLDSLGETLDRAGRANLLLMQNPPENAALEAALGEAWQAEDAGLEMHQTEGGQWELRSERVLLDPSVESIIREAVPGARGVFTYLVNALTVGDQSAPYSMVTAVEPGDAVLPEGASADEAVINQWLAEDLGAAPGDTLTLAYHIFSPGRKLIEKEASFQIAGIAPMDGPAMNASWTPDFPGVSEAENCRDWEPGIPVDLQKIGEEDERYWDTYKGTPKAFITLERGQELWQNRFGRLTSFRFPEGFEGEAFGPQLDDLLEPEDFGVHLIDLKRNRQAAVTHSLDFGLYLSMLSYFIIVAAIILTVLLFALGLDQRQSQVGTLRALGFQAHAVRKAYFLEGLVVAVIGSLLGVAGGLGYTMAMLGALRSVWSGAIGGMEMVFAPRWESGLVGANVILFVAVVALLVATRRISKRQPVELLSGSMAEEKSRREAARPLRRRPLFWIWLVTLALAAISLLAGGGQADAFVQTLTFFAAGSLALLAGLLGAALLLGQASVWLRGRQDLLSLGIRNSARKRGRSLAVIIVMAAGVFMVCATNAFRQDAAGADGGRKSGTGGFALVGESSLPLYEDLQSPETRELYALDDEDLPFSVVPFRVREGEEASCLNLNQAQRPRLMGVDPGPLAGEGGREGAFTFQAVASPRPAAGESPWTLLNREFEEGVIPGIMDFNSATYALKVGLGDEIIYEDESGRALRVRLVGLLQNSLLQGSVMISEEHFLEAYPSAGGYRYFLVEAAPEVVEDLSALMTRMLGDWGLSLTPTAERLNAFNQVQNTYLQMFSTLGGLGLLLGTAGLGVVTFRNILERRRELALMEAVGFTRPRLTWLVVSEHWFLHGLAVLLGSVASFLAIYPALSSSGQQVPALMIGGLLLLIFAGGLAFCWGAARAVLRQPLLESLRHE